MLFLVNHAVEISRGGHVITHAKAFAVNLLALLFGGMLLVASPVEKSTEAAAQD
jgi:hypothetical protein